MYMCFVVRKLILRLLYVEKLLDWHLEIMVFIFMSSETTPMVWWFSFVRVGMNAFYSAPHAAMLTFASAILATAILSVCPSITRRYCVKTMARSTAPSDNKMCLVL